jgi:hypothetical protein
MGNHTARHGGAGRWAAGDERGLPAVYGAPRITYDDFEARPAWARRALRRWLRGAGDDARDAGLELVGAAAPEAGGAVREEVVEPAATEHPRWRPPSEPGGATRQASALALWSDARWAGNRIRATHDPCEVTCRARRILDCRIRTRCFSSTRIFVAWGSTPRRGRRVVAMTLAAHYKPFWSARTARDPRAPDLVGALLALWRADRRGGAQQGGLG